MDLFYRAVSLTKAKQVPVIGSPLFFIMSTTCTDKMEGRPGTSCMQSWTVLRYEGVVRIMKHRTETLAMYCTGAGHGQSRKQRQDGRGVQGKGPAAHE